MNYKYTITNLANSSFTPCTIVSNHKYISLIKIMYALISTYDNTCEIKEEYDEYDLAVFKDSKPIIGVKITEIQEAT